MSEPNRAKAPARCPYRVGQLLDSLATFSPRRPFLVFGLRADVFLERFVGVRPDPPVHAEAPRAETLLVQCAQFVDAHVQAFSGLNLVVDPAARAGGLEPRDA